MKRFYAIPVKSSINDLDYGHGEYEIEAWAKRLGGKWHGASFMDDCWALIMFPTLGEAKKFLKFLRYLGVAGYHFGKPSNKWGYKIRGVVNDWIHFGTGKKELA